jgi:hypothetical protein
VLTTGTGWGVLAQQLSNAGLSAASAIGKVRFSLDMSCLHILGDLFGGEVCRAHALIQLQFRQFSRAHERRIVGFALRLAGAVALVMDRHASDH